METVRQHLLDEGIKSSHMQLQAIGEELMMHKRQVKQRLMNINGFNVLRTNNYTLQQVPCMAGPVSAPHSRLQYQIPSSHKHHGKFKLISGPLSVLLYNTTI